ncbi:MAG: ABC transporter ATP-binding protein [Gemmatimonadales bacterium]
MIARADHVTFAYPNAAAPAVNDVSFTLAAGSMTALVGPNGGGKTTLLRLLLGRLTPDRGEVTLWDRPASAWARRELARRIGVVVQREEPVFPLKVRDAVALGRYAHLGRWQSFGRGDWDAVDRALAEADAVALKDRWTQTLSGGEWQRVRLARALAQDPALLVLDEPTANLDVRHEMEVFELVAEQVRSAGRAALVVTHHVNLAARFADHLVVMRDGAIAAQGTPTAVLTKELLEDVFDWPVDVTTWHDTPQFIPMRKSP